MQMNTGVETSSIKLQTSKKLQASSLKTSGKNAAWSLKFEAYLKFEVWSLKFFIPGSKRISARG